MDASKWHPCTRKKGSWSGLSAWLVLRSLVATRLPVCWFLVSKLQLGRKGWKIDSKGSVHASPAPRVSLPER